MEVKYEIPDDKFRNFTNGAKNRLQEQSTKYTLEIIDESEKIENLIRENGASTEITENIVLQAVRRNKTEKKKNIKIIFVRIISELLLFFSGLMFLPDRFITAEGTFNVTYFSVFAIVTIIALITTIVTYFLGGE